MGEGDEDVVMKRKPRKSTVPIISNADWLAVAIYSLCITAAVIGIELYSLRVQKIDDKVVNNITFYTLILAQLWHVFNMSSRETSLFRNQITENKYIWIALILCVLTSISVYFISPVRSALSLVEMEVTHVVEIAIASLLPVALIQLLKRVFKVTQ